MIAQCSDSLDTTLATDFDRYVLQATKWSRRLRQTLINTLIVSRLRDSGPSLTRDDLRRLEVDLDVVLPDDYCEFLLIRNGGCYYDQLFIEFPRPDDEPLAFFYFHALDSTIGLPCDDLREVNKSLQGRLPRGAIAIGGTDEERLLLCRPPNQGLFTWQEWGDDGEPSADHGLKYTAESFAAFAQACIEADLLEKKCTTIENAQPFIAIELRRQSILEKCLRNGFHLQDVNWRGQTALFVACRTLNYEAAKLLLEYGADPDDGSRSTGRPPLYAAAGASAGELCKLLFSFGASQLLPGEDKISVLDILPHPPSGYIRSIFEKDGAR